MKKMYVSPSMHERDVKVKCMMKVYSNANTDSVGNMQFMDDCQSSDVTSTHDIWVDNSGVNSDNLNGLQF